MDNIMADAKSKHCHIHIEIYKENDKTETAIGKTEAQQCYTCDVDNSHTAQVSWPSFLLEICNFIISTKPGRFVR